MSQDSLAKELALLRREVEEIRRQQKIDSKTSCEKLDISDRKIGPEKEVRHNEAGDVLKDILEHAKHEYDNLSPVSSLLLFSLGVAFGSAISKNGGRRS
jgi:hypothetical protein